MKNKLNSFWTFLNGKKTLIGLLIAVIYSGLVAQGIIERDATIEWIVLAITGVGIGHKIVKSWIYNNNLKGLNHNKNCFIKAKDFYHFENLPTDKYKLDKKTLYWASTKKIS